MAHRRGGCRDYDGASRTQAVEIAGVTLQIARDWVVRFNAAGPEGLIDRKAPSQAALLSEALAGMIESEPTPAIHGVVRWRIVELFHWLFGEFLISVPKQTLSRQRGRPCSARCNKKAMNLHL